MTASETTATTSGRESAARLPAMLSARTDQARFVRFPPRTRPTTIAMKTPNANDRPTWASIAGSRASRMPDRAAAPRISRPRRIPQPIEPKIHSPRNSGSPTPSRRTAKIAVPTAIPT